MTLGRNEDQYDEEESIFRGNFLLHLPSIVRERLLLIVIPTILLLSTGIAAAYLLPIVYRSTTTLLVESPQLPDDVLGGADEDLVDRRIERFKQRVLSRPRLIELIQTYRLYADQREGSSLSEIVEEMREAIQINAVSAQIQRSVRGRSSTIAIELSFDYSDPSQAQAVAQDITEQFLLLDATNSSEQADNTVKFLTEQTNTLQAQIDDVAAAIEKIKARNGLELNPGMLSMNDTSGNYDVQIIALQRDNTLLRAERAARETASERDPLVAAAEADLAAAQAKYTENHPDIAIAKRRLDEARQLAAANQAKLPDDTIDQQIEANNAQIEALRAMKAQEVTRLADVQSAMARSPLIQQRIAQQQQRLDLFNEQYESVTGRLRQAQANARAESEQKGERLSVIDPPVVPDDPISPNRPVLIAGGLLSGIGLGLFLALGLELFFRPLRDPEDIRRVVGSKPLGFIPTIESETEEQRRSWFSFLNFGWFRRREEAM